jgi:endoglucanase
MQRTDPTAAGVMNTYFIKHQGCTVGASPLFKPQVDAMKAAIGNFPVLIFIEMDGTDATCWTNPALVTERQQLIKYEVDQFAQLPHALLYLEAGASDANSVSEAVMMLNHEDAQLTRGFYLNDTHFAWTNKQIQFGNAISQQTGGLHFVVDTRANGNGPKVHPPPGVEVLCNPSGRAMGPKPGASDGRAYGMYSKYLDGFVWVSTPGDSGGKHCPGDPHTYAAGFDENIALDYASDANDRVGPTPPYPSRPW